MHSFANLKNNRSQNFKTLLNKVNSLGQGKNFGDEDARFWELKVDKEQNGFAILRFLPNADAETNPDSIPFVMIWDHGFKGPGGWYINKSLTSIDKPDPLAEYNTTLWNRDHPGDRDFVSGTPGKSGSKRRLSYYSNVLIVKDPANPENEGKVKIFKYGKKIYDKLRNAMEPKSLDPDIKKIDPFDMWDGANFRLSARRYEGYRNYDESKFDAPSPIAGGDDQKIEEIFKQAADLRELLDPKNFKTYAELKSQLNRVLNVTVEEQTAPPAQRAVSLEETSSSMDTTPPFDIKSEDEDDDKEMAEFRKMLEN